VGELFLQLVSAKQTKKEKNKQPIERIVKALLIKFIAHPKKIKHLHHFVNL
jgi:hypothetical protein